MNENIKFDLDDILICPSDSTSLNSRTQVDNKRMSSLPIIVAPMDTVIDKHTAELYKLTSIDYCFPRGNKDQETLPYVKGFTSFGLNEFKFRFIDNEDYNCSKYLLIDIANGHISELEDIICKFKEKYGNLYKLMVGNIANPVSYKRLSLAGADYIRIGIGNGNGCLTTKMTGVGYPMGSLISSCQSFKVQLKMNRKNAAKIVADGGMKTYSDIIKSLALGADHVMIGSMLNKTLESAGKTTLYGIKINQYSKFAKKLYKWGFPIKKKFRGMSTKEVQLEWGKKNLRTSEGVIRYRKIEYTLSEFIKEFNDYLKSAMIYSDCKTLDEFIGSNNIIHITDNSYRRFNK